jgi:hypothetical protein
MSSSRSLISSLRRRRLLGATAVAAAGGLVTMTAAAAYAGPTGNPSATATLANPLAPSLVRTGPSAVIDPSPPWFPSARPTATPAGGSRFPSLTTAPDGATSGVIELQLSTATFLHAFERRAHDQLRGHAGLAQFVTERTGGRFTYRDTLLSGAIVAAPTALVGAVGDDELVIAADVDVVVSPTDPAAGVSSLVHLPGKVWLKLKPGPAGLAYQLADGYVDLPGRADPLYLVDPVQPGPAVNGTVAYPSLPASLGGAGARVGFAHDTHDGTGGTVAFRFATGFDDHLDAWAGPRLGGAPGALFLPGAIFVRQAADELTDQLSGTSAKSAFLRWDCCNPAEWKDRHTHVRGTIDARATIVNPIDDVEVTGHIDVDLDVTGTASVDGHGDFRLGFATSISWNTDLPGVVDGFINDAVKDVLKPPSGMHGTGGDDNTVEFADDTPRAIPPPDLVHGAFFDAARTVDDGYLATLAVHPDGPAWTESGPAYGTCSSEMSEPVLTVANHGWPGAPLPALLAPVEVTPGTVTVSTRSVWEPGTMANAVEITLGQWRRLPIGTTITAVVRTDIGRHDWRFTVPAPPDPLSIAASFSQCHPPIGDPLGDIHNCWMCGVAVDPAGAVTNPLNPIGQLPPIAVGR